MSGILDRVIKDGVRQLTYGEFLDILVNKIESLSPEGELFWENIYDEIEVYLPNQEQSQFLTEWHRRSRIKKTQLNLQCAYLYEEGILSRSDVGEYSVCFIEEKWRGGEYQTAEILLNCKGDKVLIASALLLSYLESKYSRNTYSGRDRIFLRKCENEINSKANRYSNPKFEIIKSPESEIVNCARLLLGENDIHCYWNQANTKLLPLAFDDLRYESYFRTIYDYIDFIAERFILVFLHLSVTTFSISPEKNLELMNQVDSIVNRNKTKELAREKLRQQQLTDEIVREKETAKQYKKLCSEIVEYADELPNIFTDLSPLCYHWRTLSKNDLEKLIWSAPMTTLSKMFGKSDNGVRKWGKENKIKLPIAGYWAKVKAGKLPYPNGKPAGN